MRLSSTGGTPPDATFSTGTGPISSPANAFSLNNSTVNTLVYQPEGRLLAGGIFNQYNGIPASRSRA